VTRAVPVAVGELLRLRDVDYRYGSGALVIRVTGVAEVVADPDWIDIRGIEIDWNGNRLGERSVQMSVTALRDPRRRLAP
jgi:hypothetical protein